MAEKLGTVRDVAKMIVKENNFLPEIIDLLPKQLLERRLIREDLYELLEEVQFLRLAKKRLLLRATHGYRPVQFEGIPRDMREKLNELIQVFLRNPQKLKDWVKPKVQEIRFLEFLGAQVLWNVQ